MEVPDSQAYIKGAWFGIGTFITSAGWALYLQRYTLVAVCVVGAGLWYVGSRQAGIMMGDVR